MPKKKKKKSWIRKTSFRMFGDFSRKYEKKFWNLKYYFLSANLNFLFKTYISMMFFSILFAFLVTATVIFIFSVMIGLNALYIIFGMLSVAGTVSSATFFFFYFYPFYLTNKRKTNIETNLPFAITHMAAIASSGVPPYSMFKILSEFEEYGEITQEAKKIVRNMDTFGLSEISALKDVIKKSPSSFLKEFLQGVLSTMKTGGNLRSFLNQEAEKSMFEYRINRERYNQLLSTYADFYTAILIAAPLLFITILLIINIMGGQILGMPVLDVLKIGIFILIPVMNVLFLLFIHITQPKS